MSGSSNNANQSPDQPDEGPEKENHNETHLKRPKERVRQVGANIGRLITTAALGAGAKVIIEKAIHEIGNH